MKISPQNASKTRECHRRMKGFTLVEVITAVFLLTVGVVGVFSLVNYVLSITQIAASRLVAAYLAQEGIEIVRNIRDGNWLERSQSPALAWDEGIPDGDWEADYTTGTTPGQGLFPYSGNYLRRSAQGFYVRPPGNEPGIKFVRRINIRKSATSTIEVTVFVTWEERGRTHTFAAEDILKNWR